MRSLICAMLLAAGFASSALAQSAQRDASEKPEAGKPETSDKPSQQPSIQTSLGPYGDPGGVRAALEAKGVTYSLTYIGEILGNVSGGMRRGAIGQGRLDIQFDTDLEKLLGWSGAAFHANVYQIHGAGLSRYYVGNLLVTSGIEALPSSRLYELWLEQKLADGKLALRAGQLAADTEFVVSQYASLFVNSTFGWPASHAANLPSGGPAYPLATPAARLKFAPNDRFTLLAAIFNGDPAGPQGFLDDPDPQRRNRTGTDFRLHDPPFVITEAAFAYNQEKDARGLPGTVKLGGWHHFGRFNDLRIGGDGLSLADPASSGLARRLRANDGVYAVLDKMVYRMPDTTDQGIGVFLRASAGPSDRNLIDAYLDGGVTFKGMLPGRADDTFGIGFGYARISDRARALDADTALFTGGYPIRHSEALIEVTYQAQIVPGWTVQPDFQYVFRPGGNVPNPRDPTGAPIQNAAIFGVRTTIRY